MTAYASAAAILVLSILTALIGRPRPIGLAAGLVGGACAAYEIYNEHQGRH